MRYYNAVKYRATAAVPGLILVTIRVLAVAQCFAQGYLAHLAAPNKSFTQWIELDLGIATAMVTDAGGNAYVAAKSASPPAGGYVAKIAPDGSVLYKTAFYNNPFSLALGDAGWVWVGGIGKFNSQGHPFMGPSRSPRP